MGDRLVREPADTGTWLEEFRRLWLGKYFTFLHTQSCVCPCVVQYELGLREGRLYYDKLRALYFDLLTVAPATFHLTRVSL